jgi:hypothetical protein
MSPEQIERMNAGALEDEVQDALENLDQVTEALAGRIEPQQKEILEGVTECRKRLDVLSTQLQTAPAESPLLNRLMEELLSLKAEVQSLKSSMEQIRSIPLPNVSEPVPVQIVEVTESSEPRAEGLTVEPSGDVEPVPEPESPKKRHRVL